MAAQIGVDGCRTDAACIFGKAALQLTHHLGCLVNGLRRMELRCLSSLQGLERDRYLVLNHQLQHKARHLGCFTIAGGIVIKDGYIFCTLQQTMEIMLVDRYLVIDCGQSVGLTQGIGDKRGIVNATWHVTLVAREQKHMVEVEVSSFEHTHHLDSFGRFAMEGNRGG